MATRRTASVRRDRVLAAIEIPALGIWLGALVGFAFISAPAAFRIIAPLDVARFSTLIAETLGRLTRWGEVLGGLAFVVILLRSSAAADRTLDAIRALLVAGAVAVAYYHQRVIVQQMRAIPDVTSPAFHALHARSTQVYGLAVLLVLTALVLAAWRGNDA